MVYLGKLGRTQGLDGGIRFMPVFEPPQQFELLDLKTCRFHWQPQQTKAGVPTNTGAPRVLSVEGYWYHQQFIILEFAGHEGIDAVAPLCNGTLSVEMAQMWPPQEGEYREYELADMRVINEETGDEVGTVLGLQDGAAHTYLRVRAAASNGGKIFLLPFVQEIFITSISRERREIRARMVEGLMDL